MGIGPDPWSFVWYLQWWPWAIGHLIDPLYSNLIWYPTGYSMTWTTSIPTLALLALPITLMVNAVVAYNVLALLAPALSAWTAFLLARSITRDVPASLIGGLLFGFSSYETGQMLGHLNLTMIFLVPMIGHLVVARVNGTLSRRRYIAGFVLCLGLQFGISTEIFATLCVFGGMAWLLFLAFTPVIAHRRLVVTLLEAGVAFGVLLVLLMPYFIAMALASPDIPQFNAPPILFSTDTLNFFVPTLVTRFGRAVFADISGHFTGNGSEQGAYLGLPLILIMILYAQTARRQGVALLLATVLVAFASLGPTIWINGHMTGIPGPWRVFASLPLIEGALPSRFSMYVSLGVALVTAIWLTEAASRAGRIARYVLACLGYLLLVPNPSLVAWRPLPLLPFFSPTHIEAELDGVRNVIVLPFTDGPGMLWQWQSGMRFTQTGGNTSLIPASFGRLPIVQALLSGTPNPSFAADFRAFCVGHAVTDVLVGAGTPPALEAALDALGWPNERQGGVRIFRVPT